MRAIGEAISRQQACSKHLSIRSASLTRLEAKHARSQGSRNPLLLIGDCYRDLYSRYDTAIDISSYLLRPLRTGMARDGIAL